MKNTQNGTKNGYSVKEQVTAEQMGLNLLMNEKEQEEFISKVKTERELLEEKRQVLSRIKDQMILHNHNKLENERVCFKLNGSHMSHSTDIGMLHKKYPAIYAELQKNREVAASVKMEVKKD